MKRLNLELDIHRYEGRVNGILIRLSILEFNLLRYFLENAEAVKSREQIINEVWNGTAVGERSVDHHVSSLRRKLKKANSNLEFVACYGEGYALKEIENG